MVNDKNRLYTGADLAKDRKFQEKTRTSYGFSHFSVAATDGLNSTAETATSPATQIITKPQIGEPNNDVYGNVGLQTVLLDIFGSSYSILSITGDASFVFNKIPRGQHIEFTIDFIVNTGTPPIVTLDARIINPPTLPTLTNGLRVVMDFIGVRDDTSTRFTHIGGTLSAGGGGGSSAGSAFLTMTASQTTGPTVLFNSNTISGTGISATTTTGVFKLSGSIFLLEAHGKISVTSAGEAFLLWQTATDEAFTTPVDVGVPAIMLPSTSTSDESTQSAAGAVVDAVAADVFVRLEFDPQSPPTVTLEEAFTWATITNFLGGGGGGGGGAVDFPIDFPEEADRGTVVTNQVIDFSQSTRHSVAMTVGIPVISLDFQNEPTDKLALSSITMKQDATGGRAFTFVDTVVNGQLIIDAFAALGTTESISFMIEWERGIFTAYLKTSNVVSGGGGGDVSTWSTFPATQSVNMANNSIVALTLASIVDTGGIPRGGITGDAGATALRIFHQAGEKEIHSVGITDILQISNTGGLEMLGTTHNIDLNGNNILEADHINFDTTGTFEAGAIPAIGYNTGASRLRINTGATTDILEIRAGNEAIATIARSAASSGLLTIDNITVSKILDVTELMGIGNTATDPVSNGQFRRNVNDIKVFSGGAVRNLSLVGVPVASNTISQLDSSVIVTDTGSNGLVTFNIDGSAVATFDSVALSAAIPIDMTVGKDIVAVGKIRFTSNTDVIANSEATIALRSDDMDFNVAALIDRYQLKFNGTVKHTFTQNDLTSPSVILNNTLVFNDNAADPIATGVFSRNGNRMKVECADFVVQRTTGTGGNSATMSLVKVDASPANGDNIGAIHFSLLDSPTETIYAQILGEVKDATDSGTVKLQVRTDNSSLQDAIVLTGANTSALTFIEIPARIASDLIFGVESGSTRLKIFPNVNTFGIAFNNISNTVGDRGSFQIPEDPGNAVDAATADTDFGDKVSNMGLYLNGVGTPILVIKIDDSPTTWATLVLNASGNITGNRLT